MFEWDEAKSQATFRARGFDFSFASRIFDHDFYEIEDARRDYGERRLLATGRIEGRFYTVVYTQRGDTRRIISAREASRKERNAYRALYG